MLSSGHVWRKAEDDGNLFFGSSHSWGSSSLEHCVASPAEVFDNALLAVILEHARPSATTVETGAIRGTRTSHGVLCGWQNTHGRWSLEAVWRKGHRHSLT